MGGGRERGKVLNHPLGLTGEVIVIYRRRLYTLRSPVRPALDSGLAPEVRILALPVLVVLAPAALKKAARVFTGRGVASSLFGCCFRHSSTASVYVHIFSTFQCPAFSGEGLCAPAFGRMEE